MSNTVAEALQQQEVHKAVALEDAYLTLRCLTKHILEFPVSNAAINHSIQDSFNSVILAKRSTPISDDESNRILAALVERNLVNRLDLAEQSPESIQKTVRDNVWILEVGLGA